MSKNTRQPAKPPATRVGLKTLAEYLDLSPATISLVLNQSPVAEAIPPRTRQRVIDAAKKFNYRPNSLARSLRMSCTHTIGIIAPEHSEGYFTNIMMGIEGYLIQAGYLYFTVSHLGRKDLLEEYPRLLMGRNVDGFLLINTNMSETPTIPTVALASHASARGVTTVLIDHDRAAMAMLQHLHDLGHRRIAFMKGQPESLDAEPRWKAFMTAARKLKLTVHPELVVALTQNVWTPDLGYPSVMELMRRTKDFTAIVCFNDLAAIGAIRAIADCGLKCPKDISVVGFDDISSAGYSIPRLTTMRQPLVQMGEAAAKTLIAAIEGKDAQETPSNLVFQPELVVRESTAPALPRRSSRK